MIPGSANPLLLKSAAAAGGYQVSRSLRFNSSDSAYLSRTPAVAGNRKTWTWAGWIKRNKLGTTQQFLTCSASGYSGNWSILGFSSSDKLGVYFGIGSNPDLQTTAVYRDPSAWMHVLINCDTTQATAANRGAMYVNGVKITAFDFETYRTQNFDTDFNTTSAHDLGRQSTGNYYCDFMLADIHFIDGQALTPSSFTEVSATTGQLIPKAYSGTFGTNGFWLKFSDNSAATAATLGKDYSGNSNNWTPNNLSVTAGAGNDSLVDTPTSISATDTGVGGEIRGNYATLNPLLPTLTPTNGNLDTPNSAGQNYSTIAISTGKWYVESTVGPITAGTACGLGLHFNPTADTGAGFYTSGAYIALLYENNLARYEGANSNVNFYPTAGAGSILAIKIDLDSGTQTISYYVNNVLITSSNLPAGKTWFVTTRQNNNQSLNFGQRAFAYTAPSGFKALCDTNLPAPLTAKPNTVMDVVLWTGNATARTISGLNFSPDLVWIKNRTTASSHTLYDTIRGATKILVPNGTDAELTLTNFLTAFTSDGFSIGTDNNLNGSGNGVVGWAWDAGTSTVSNTAGSITSQVRANVSAGFSIVKYTNVGSTNSTIGHGLGVAPKLMIVRYINQTSGWYTYHADTGAGKYLELQSTNSAATLSSMWNNTAPTSTVFSVGTAWTSSIDTLAYCFAPVVGYSSFGSYVGNGSTDGVFVYTGFRPRWIMIKGYVGTAASIANWLIIDASRDTYNVSGYKLAPNLADAENSANIGTFDNNSIDILSNGFKNRSTNGSSNNGSTSYIYAAFAENPFQYARAR